MTGSQKFGCVIGVGYVTALLAGFVVGCITGRWNYLGVGAAVMFGVPIYASFAYGKKTPQVRYCPRCGTHHQLPKGPNCPR